MSFMGILGFAGCSFDDSELWDEIHKLDDRLTAVENQVSELNNNVGNFRTLLLEFQSKTWIESYRETSDGLSITFSNGNTVTIPNGLTPFIGSNGNWWIGDKDTGVKAGGTDGQTPFIGKNGNWWIGDSDTGVKAAGTDGQTPFIGSNGNWWIGDSDTGVKALAQSPYIGDNGNWWIGDKDTGVKAEGTDGQTPFIGENGNWWVGGKDTGVKASNGGEGSSSVIGVAKGEDNVYYWTITNNGATDWIYDDNGKKLPCSGTQPIFRVGHSGELQYSIDGGVSWLYVMTVDGDYVNLSGNNCTCTQFFQNVYIQGNYLHMILIDGTDIIFQLKSGGNRGGIPEDPNEPNPDVQDPNTTIPNPSGEISSDEWGNIVYTMTLSGIQDIYGDWLKLYGTGDDNQNLWVEVDGSPKGILVINLEDNTTRVKNDIIFSVDNSGSMSEEADAVARDILNWSSMLSNKGLDVQYAVVGYDGRITGAHNLCDANELSSYLNSNGTGVNRTYHFGGSDASSLKSAANKYANGYNECGVAAVRYANENFTFRAGSNRVYVNFTDEPNQPNGNSDFSVTYFNSQTNWPSQYGTIHSVYSDTNTSYSETNGYKEYPWRMSEYTGGTKIFTSSSFAGVSLDKLPVSDAILHSYTIKFIIPQNLLDGLPHTVKIILQTKDGKTRGILTLNNYIFGFY